MTTAPEIYQRAARLGLTLEARGDKLAVIPAQRCPPDFADVLRRHKRELLDLLETKTGGLPVDCVPWLHVARQILAGEFDGADNSTVRSLTIGLRGIRHALCQQALLRLKRTDGTIQSKQAAPILPMVEPPPTPPQVRGNDDDADSSRRRRES
jgi:hypothetical protein